MARGSAPRLALLGAAALLARSAVRFSVHRPQVPGDGRWLQLARGFPRAAASEALVGGSVLVRNGHAAAPWLDKSRLLTDYTGAYTTMRTVNCSSVFELSMHCQRLHDTASSVMGKKLEEGQAAPALQQACQFLREGGAQAIKPLIVQELAAGLSYLEGLDGKDSADDFQVTVVLTCDSAGDGTPADRGFDVFTYVQPMSQVAPMVDAEAHRATRPDPTIKSSQWVRDREGLEAIQKKAGVNEVVMFDADGGCTEGLQTNFFAVAADGTVWTAPDELVLAGTVRKVVLEVCEKHGIPVRFERPTIHEASTWESCFIASTSRLVKPIHSLRVPEHGLDRSFPAAGSVAHRIEALVKAAVDQNSERIAK